MEDFEIFTGYHSRATDKMLVSIRQDGNLAINSASMKALHNPESVELCFNRVKKQIGIRVALKADGARVRKQPRCRNYIIASKAFLKAYSIDFSVTRRFEATLQSEILVIDLNS
jgi:hypothetical protein